MATFEEIGQAVSNIDGTLFTRLLGGVVVVAGDIRVESPATPNHANRLIWADDVSKDSKSIVRVFFQRLLQNSNVQDAISNPGSVTDAQIQAAIEGIVDEFATGGV